MSNTLGNRTSNVRDLLEWIAADVDLNIDDITTPPVTVRRFDPLAAQLILAVVNDVCNGELHPYIGAALTMYLGTQQFGMNHLDTMNELGNPMLRACYARIFRFLADKTPPPGTEGNGPMRLGVLLSSLFWLELIMRCANKSFEN